MGPLKEDLVFKSLVLLITALNFGEGRTSNSAYYLYQVSTEPCTTVNVRLKSVSESTLGLLSEIMEISDVSLLLDIPGTLNGEIKINPSENNNKHQDKVYRLYLPEDLKEPRLEVKLMQKDLVMDTETEVGTKSISLKDLSHETKHDYQLQFTDEASVSLEVELLPCPDVKIRLGQNASEGEQDFLKKRRNIISHALEDVEGMDSGNKKAPVVALLGSGGGFRAMIGFSGVYKALYDTGLMDTISYTGAISGSTWWQSFFFTNAEKGNAGRIQQMLKKSALKRNPYKQLFLSETAESDVNKIFDDKEARGHPISATDVYGVLIKDILLKDHPDARLSDHQQYVSTARAPFPIYASVLVNKHYSAREKHQWLEWNPYEVSIPQWEVHQPIHTLDSNYYLGRITNPHPEAPLHYLQATWGNAFAIHLPKIIELAGLGNTGETKESKEFDESQASKEPEESQESEESKESEEDDEDRVVSYITREKDDNSDKEDSSQGWLDYIIKEGSPYWRSTAAAFIPNPVKGLKKPTVLSQNVQAPTTQEGVISMDDSFLTVVDAGVVNNIPFAPLLAPERQVDIFLAFDFSSRPSDKVPVFEEIVHAEEWAALHGVPFPTVASKVEQYKKEPPREYYIFKDEDGEAPVIIYFMIVNSSFREFKRPDVPRETKEEKEFADFELFSSSSPYSTFNFYYEDKDFDRLAQLMEYNTLLAVDDIKRELKEFRMK